MYHAAFAIVHYNKIINETESFRVLSKARIKTFFYYKVHYNIWWGSFLYGYWVDMQNIQQYIQYIYMR